MQIRNQAARRHNPNDARAGTQLENEDRRTGVKREEPSTRSSGGKRKGRIRYQRREGADSDREKSLRVKAHEQRGRDRITREEAQESKRRKDRYRIVLGEENRTTIAKD